MKFNYRRERKKNEIKIRIKLRRSRISLMAVVTTRGLWEVNHRVEVDSILVSSTKQFSTHWKNSCMKAQPPQ